MQSDLLHTLRWVRTLGDVVFIVGALAVSWRVVKGVFDRDTMVLDADAVQQSSL